MKPRLEFFRVKRAPRLVGFGWDPERREAFIGFWCWCLQINLKPNESKVSK